MRRLFQPVDLPCGARLKNRIAKSAMSDSLGDGTGHPTPAQRTLYQRWAEGGAALSIIGEVQGTPHFAEKPGNLVLNDASELPRFQELSHAGRTDGGHIWPQLGHAGALAFAPTSTPKGPSALDLPGLTCGAFTLAEVRDLPREFARTAALAKRAGFTGVQVHAAHGFLLSQFLSPLFNKRGDAYGGSLINRARLLLETVEAVRDAVGPEFPVAVKLNSSDQLEGGLMEQEALSIVAELDQSTVDLIDISGGTYFPGAKAASDSAGSGAYFLEFAKQARSVCNVPLMVTGGIKSLTQATEAIETVDIVGLARALVLDPDLPRHWAIGEMADPAFPRFESPPEGGVTAWYTMRLTEIGEGKHLSDQGSMSDAISAYAARDALRTEIWQRHFRPERAGRP